MTRLKQWEPEMILLPFENKEKARVALVLVPSASESASTVTYHAYTATGKFAVTLNGEQGASGWRYQYTENGKHVDLVYYPGVNQWRQSASI
jgi:hypothetical protein